MRMCKGEEEDAKLFKMVRSCSWPSWVSSAVLVDSDLHQDRLLGLTVGNGWEPARDLGGGSWAQKGTSSRIPVNQVMRQR